METDFTSTLLRSRPPNRLATTNQINELVSAFSRLHDGDVAGKNGTPFIAYCKITGNESGPGKYTCDVFGASPNLFDPSRPVQESDLEGTPIVQDAVLINVREVGESTHLLSASSGSTALYYAARWDGYTAEATPRMVFVVNGPPPQPRLLTVTGATSLGGNRWSYSLKIAQLNSDPSGGSPWGADPDSSTYTGFNLREYGNTASAAYNGEVAFNSAFTGIARVPNGAVVLASPAVHSGATTWHFQYENKANVDCG
jgi:hypothetical protein